MLKRFQLYLLAALEQTVIRQVDNPGLVYHHLQQSINSTSTFTPPPTRLHPQLVLLHVEWRSCYQETFRTASWPVSNQSIDKITACPQNTHQNHRWTEERGADYAQEHTPLISQSINRKPTAPILSWTPCYLLWNLCWKMINHWRNTWQSLGVALKWCRFIQ